MSERTLARRFEAEVGMSLRSWRRRLRLFKAIELMDGDLDVTRAAMELGYRGGVQHPGLHARTCGGSVRMTAMGLGRVKTLWQKAARVRPLKFPCPSRMSGSASQRGHSAYFWLYRDVVWSRVGVSCNHVRTRAMAPGITGMVGRALDLDFRMAIVEVGAAYEAARSGPLAPVIGARVRYAIAPGHKLFLQGDIGGFGIGSDFSWQAIGGYGVDSCASSKIEENASR